MDWMGDTSLLRTRRTKNLEKNTIYKIIIMKGEEGLKILYTWVGGLAPLYMVKRVPLNNKNNILHLQHKVGSWAKATMEA